jgi:hypothetical protein
MNQKENIRKARRIAVLALIDLLLPLRYDFLANNQMRVRTCDHNGTPTRSSLLAGDL